MKIKSLALALVAIALFSGQSFAKAPVASAEKEKPGMWERFKESFAGHETPHKVASKSHPLRVHRWNVVLDALKEKNADPAIIAWAEKNKHRAQTHKAHHKRRHHGAKHGANAKSVNEKQDGREKKAALTPGEKAEKMKRKKARKHRRHTKRTQMETKAKA